MNGCVRSDDDSAVPRAARGPEIHVALLVAHGGAAAYAVMNYALALLAAGCSTWGVRAPV